MRWFSWRSSKKLDTSEAKEMERPLYTVEKKDGVARYVVNKTVIQQAAAKAAAVGASEIARIRDATQEACMASEIVGKRPPTKRNGKGSKAAASEMCSFRESSAA